MLPIKLNKIIYQKIIVLFFFCLLAHYENDLKYESMCLERSWIARHRRKKERVSWDEVCTCMSKYQFRRRWSRNIFVVCSIGTWCFQSIRIDGRWSRNIHSQAKIWQYFWVIYVRYKVNIITRIKSKTYLQAFEDSEDAHWMIGAWFFDNEIYLCQVSRDA